MPGKPAFLLVVVAAMLCWLTPAMGEDVGRTRVTVVNGQWHLNGTITHPGSAAEGLLMNVRMVNAIFEDRARHLDFDAEANTDHFIARIPDYAAHGVNAFTICLQGAMPGYEVANEYPHQGFAHAVIRDPRGQASLIKLARNIAPGLLVSAGGYGDRAIHPEVAAAADFPLPHWNSTKVEQIPDRIAALKRFSKPIVTNEDDKRGADAVAAMRATVANGASYGLMLQQHNQTFPFRFDGAADDPVFYAELRKLTTPPEQPAPNGVAGGYFPPPESQGGWRKLEKPDDLHQLAGMNPPRLDELREWLLQSDDRNFAAVVIRNGYIVLEIERGNSARTDSRRVASVSKAVCATVLAIASEQSLQGKAPRGMTFDDPAFDFIPWAQPLCDPCKANITVRQLLNHTSGICPEAISAPNDGTWEYILGLRRPLVRQYAAGRRSGCGWCRAPKFLLLWTL